MATGENDARGDRCTHPAALVRRHENDLKNSFGFGRCGVCGSEVDLTGPP